MIARLGLGVGRTQVRAVIVRDGEILWCGERQVPESQQLSDAIVDLLSSAPVGRFLRTPVIAALGPAAAQVKRLHGLPAMNQATVVSQVVRANVGRFFLRNGVPMSTTTAHRNADSWWGAVMEDVVVEAVERACALLRLRFDGCIPTAAALAYLVNDGCVEWQDGDVCATVTVRGGTWVDIRRDHRATPRADATPSFTRLGPKASRYADAFGAACSTCRSPLFLRASQGRASLRRHFVTRIVLTALVVVAGATALAAPGVAASRQLAHDQRRLDALRGAIAEWAPIAYQLREHTGGLEEIGRFAASRRSAVLLLGAISKALPDSTAIVTLRVDSAAGSLTLLSTRAASIIPRLAAVEEIAEPRIAGAVTRENIGGAQVQRIAVRFRLAPTRPGETGSRP